MLSVCDKNPFADDYPAAREFSFIKSVRTANFKT